MLFNSPIYLLLFLPITIIAYFALNRARMPLPAKVLLVAGSLFFYGWWNWAYLPIILLSVFFNYAVGTALNPERSEIRISRRLLLFVGITTNVLALAYFKYADFFIGNVNALTGSNLQLLGILLPLAISFFTFQQIAYLVDSYSGKTSEYDFLNYSLFVTFFPQLIAGPIVHHKEMMGQFSSNRSKILNWRNCYYGLFILGIGLFKKAFVADHFAEWASAGFSASESLSLVEAWCTSLSYTFQIYFDFSGYTDMAIGSALFFNIRLPYNFNSPYRALNIQDFWRRWHMTLSRWLRDYIYIPLGGNRGNILGVCINILVVFLIGGIWHGAGWTFLFWGVLHGSACVIFVIWSRYGKKLPSALSWLLTFLFINITWVFFRAENFSQATDILSAMFSFDTITIDSPLHIFSEPIHNVMAWKKLQTIAPWFAIFLGIATIGPNSNTATNWRIPIKLGIAIIVVLFLLGSPNIVRKSEFLYFNF